MICATRPGPTSSPDVVAFMCFLLDKITINRTAFLIAELKPDIVPEPTDAADELETDVVADEPSASFLFFLFHAATTNRTVFPYTAAELELYGFVAELEPEPDTADD